MFLSSLSFGKNILVLLKFCCYWRLLAAYAAVYGWLAWPLVDSGTSTTLMNDSWINSYMSFITPLYIRCLSFSSSLMPSCPCYRMNFLRLSLSQKSYGLLYWNQIPSTNSISAKEFDSSFSKNFGWGIFLNMYEHSLALTFASSVLLNASSSFLSSSPITMAYS